MEKKYFHELTNEEFKEAIKKKMVYEDFKQPDWCHYPFALNWEMGCWSLTERQIKKEEDCKDCDCYGSKARIPIPYRGGMKSLK